MIGISLGEGKNNTTLCLKLTDDILNALKELLPAPQKGPATLACNYSLQHESGNNSSIALKSNQG